ncbi:MAG: DUF6607 family protein [Cyclobacteriaceae bacterium]
MRYLLFLFFLISALHVQAQKQKDRQAIQNFCGCYEVSFQFAETFSPDPNYQFRENYYSKGLEWITPIAVEDDFVSLQHLLIVSYGGQQSVIKHWRQDWAFENTDFYVFAGDNRWNYLSKEEGEVSGQWTQKVFEVSDAPRYEGSATWVHVDGRHYWESTTDAPLPRREYTKRDDYNVMQRTNHHELTPEGHLHEQDNVKIDRKADRERIKAYEKGINTYTRVEDEKCQRAREWWDSNQHFWADVRAVWQEVFDQKESIFLHHKVDDKTMFMHLFPLGDELVARQDYNSEEARKRIREVISLYLDQSMSMHKK